MGIASWLRPPRRTLSVFLALMVILGSALAWLAWQWLKQDRALEGQRLQDGLEIEADGMAAALRQSLSNLEKYLVFAPGAGVDAPPAGVLVLHMTKTATDAYPADGLLFYPALADTPEPPASAFAAGEALEFQRGDSARAAAIFRDLAGSPDASLRAGALLRLGRNLRKIGRPDEALRVYEDLARLGAIAVGGLPAEIVAREASGTVLEAAGKTGELKKEAALLRSALWSGRLRMLRPAWEFHRDEAQRWLGTVLPTERELDALAATQAAETLYLRWSAEPETKGRAIRNFEDRPVLFSWMGTPDRLAAVLAGPEFLESTWAPRLLGRRVRGALLGSDGKTLIGSIDAGGRRAVRPEAATGLPGVLQAMSSDPGADVEGVAARRRFLYAGLAVLALTLLAGTATILRSIRLERETAKLQSEFVSAVSHEFRTPLTSLRQLSEMLARGRFPSEDLKQKSFDILSGESERLQRIVESLLDFSRLEGRAFRYRFETLDPAAFVGDVVAEFREKAAALGFTVELDVAEPVTPVRADRESLGLALRNLLDNAVKYSPDCRTIWVEIARERKCLAIRVRDRGLGIPHSEQKVIFKKFVRGSGSRAARIQGTGIGLAAVRLIAKAHGGSVRLASEPGRGSTFTILIPLERTS